MNAFVLLTFVAAATAFPSGVSITPVGHGPSTLVRAPAHDSASIESHRLGGNFAYATAEAHAFAQVTPQISRATFPVAETTNIHEPETIARVVPAPIVNTHHAARPVLANQAILAQQPVIGEVARHTQVHQPIFKTKHVTVHQPAPVAVPVAAPAVAVHHQPARLAYAAAPIGYAHGAAGIPLAAGAPLGYANGARFLH